MDDSLDDSEPKLAWSHLGADAPGILGSDEGTCFAASDKLHAIGCLSGAIHLLDFEGHQVR